MNDSRIEPFKHTDADALLQAAQSDGHRVLYPTNIIKQGEDIVGYVSVCATPIVTVWAHSKKIKVIQSVRLLQQLEDGMSAKGMNHYIMPCEKTSPYFPYMQKLGFVPFSENVWHFRNLRKS
jgi:hypothetical protein